MHDILVRTFIIAELWYVGTAWIELNAAVCCVWWEQGVSWTYLEQRNVHFKQQEG
jgi:hypothetical protein